MNVESNAQGVPGLQATEPVIGRQERVPRGDVRIGSTNPSERAVPQRGTRVMRPVSRQQEQAEAPTVLRPEPANGRTTDHDDKVFIVMGSTDQPVGELILSRSINDRTVGYIDYTIEENDPEGLVAKQAIAEVTEHAFAGGYTTLRKPIHKDDVDLLLTMHANGYQFEGTNTSGDIVTMVRRHPALAVTTVSARPVAPHRTQILPPRDASTNLQPQTGVTAAEKVVNEIVHPKSKTENWPEQMKEQVGEDVMKKIQEIHETNPHGRMPLVKACLIDLAARLPGSASYELSHLLDLPRSTIARYLREMGSVGTLHEVLEPGEGGLQPHLSYYPPDYPYAEKSRESVDRQKREPTIQAHVPSLRERIAAEKAGIPDIVTLHPGMGASEIAALMPGASPATVKKTLKELTEERIIARVEDKNRFRYYPMKKDQSA